ncbi:hypothetical protein E4U53_007989, partial [Claviceps sorghi]
MQATSSKGHHLDKPDPMEALLNEDEPMRMSSGTTYLLDRVVIRSRLPTLIA